MSNHAFSELSDAVVWDKFKEGNEAALSEIYHTHIDSLYNYGIKFNNNGDLVKDCIQELFFELINHRSNLGSTNNIKFYLLKSLRRKIARNSGENKYLRFEGNGDVEEGANPVPSAENLLIDEETNFEMEGKVKVLLQKLSKRQKEAIYLKFYQELGYDEISDVMSISYQSVRTIIFKAIKTLRQEVGNSNIISMFLILRMYKR
jgi:RNA polymerase sigma factor (sigma-70 family)